MNLRNNEIKNLLQIDSKWEKLFKGSLLDELLEEYEDIKSFIELITEELIPVWKEENKDMTIYYIYFLEKLKGLNMEQLQREYKIIRDFYFYSLEKEESQTDLETLYNWIDKMFIDEVITLELLEDTLDEEIHYE